MAKKPKKSGALFLFGKPANREARETYGNRPTRDDKSIERARQTLQRRLRKVPKYSDEWHAIVRELRRMADD